MSAKLILITYDKNLSEQQRGEFIEAVRSSYVSKPLYTYSSILISAPNGSSNTEIYNFLNSKLNTSISFVVIEMSSYYGNFPDESFQWVKTTFPGLDYLEPKD